jgi:hypothetical protein
MNSNKRLLKIKPISDVDEYCKKRTEWFKTKIELPLENNKNMIPLFYSSTDYEKYISQTRDYDEVWRKRILMENTPRGNIIMFYDSYKMGFSYYSDIQNISYNILNAIAMKYVIYFSCLDLYMDDQTGFSSPLNTIFLKEKSSNNRIKKQTTLSNQYVKYKSYNKHNEMSQMTELNLNRFLFLGKIVNFSFLQKIANTETKVKNYRDYKKMCK